MREIKKLPSGLVVPVEKEERKKRYPPLQIDDEERREKAKEALLLLWDAMNLTSGGSAVLSSRNTHEAYYRLYRYVGEMLLGEEDCPEKEQWC